MSSRGIISSIFLSFAAEKKRNQTSSLPPGHHAFQFSFKIPPYSLPSSFESKHGYVRYWLKARIHRPWRFDEVTKELVKILSLIDVNCPRVLVSIEMEIGVWKKMLFHFTSNFNNSSCIQQKLWNLLCAVFQKRNENIELEWDSNSWSWVQTELSLLSSQLGADHFVCSK